MKSPMFICMLWGLFLPFACLGHDWHRHDDPHEVSAQVRLIRPVTLRNRVGVSDASTVRGAAVADSASSNELAVALSFARFSPGVRVWWDETSIHVSSDGIPTHPLMEGIRAWQRQIPLPVYYFGTNSWRIPAHPVPAAKPLPITTNSFLQGAIALAANGIPIFNPANNRGEVSAQIGELDAWGGHSGRADDYHYHAAPLHLTNTVGISLPIAVAMDGYPIYGLTEPDGSMPTGLDAFNGHVGRSGSYHYHASLALPYVNGGFHGELVVQVSTNGQGQVVSQAGAQPRVNPIRPSGTALNGAFIQSFTNPAPDVFQINYSNPAASAPTNFWRYTLNRPAGSVSVTYSDAAGVRTTNYPNWRPAPPLTSVAEPLVTVNPENRVSTQGSAVKFGVIATGAEPLTFQWLRNGSPLEDGPNVSGANTRELSLQAVGVHDAATYSVMVTNRIGRTISSAASLQVHSSRSVSQGIASGVIANLLPSGQRVSAVGSMVASDGTRWTVPADTSFSTARKADDLYNELARKTPANIQDIDLNSIPIVEVDSDGEVITGYLFADNYFELYVNGMLVAVDPVPYTPFNSCVVRFRARQPVSYAIRLVDWEENLGVGTELNGDNANHPGDGGFIASFSDGTVTGKDWKAQTFYISPLSGPELVSELPDGTRDSSGATVPPATASASYAVHYPVPANWASPSFDDSSWPSASLYSEAEAGVQNKPAYLNFPDQFSRSGARFIWSSNLILDNEVIVRYTAKSASTNKPPVFEDAGLRRFVIPPGGSVSVANPARDEDLPTQKLTYKLVQNPPGATIHAGTGVVSWTPGAAQAGTSNYFSVVVSDNAIIPASSTNSFFVFVASTKPNVVIIVTDDHGYGDLGAHGGPAVTPNMDRLGREGIRLERFYATPVCSVTRSALMTGRNPIRTAVNNSRGLNLGEHIMPQTFKAAGYQTFMCGKWHLGGLYNTVTNTVLDGTTIPVVREGVEYQPQNRGWDVHYGEYTGAIGYTTHVSGETDKPDWWLNGQPNQDAGWSTDLLADKAIQLLKERDPSKPALIYLAFNAVHGPVSAPPEYLSRHAGIADVKRRTLLAALEHMDAAIGRVLAAIDSEGIATNTVVTFFGDNGGQATSGGSNLPLRGDKGDLFDGGIHTPAAIRWPGVLPSGITNCQQFVWVGDWFPTLCSATGVKPLNSKPFDGMDVWPRLLQARNGELPAGEQRPTPLVSGSSAGSAIFQTSFAGGRSTVFKLIHDRIQGRGASFTNLLFDILNDPLEQQDLLPNPDFASVVTSLTAVNDAIKPERYGPYIGVHPASRSVAVAGTRVTLHAMATVYSTPVSAQWRKNGINIASANRLVEVDDDVYLTTLEIPAFSAADAGVYEVVFSNGATDWPGSVTSKPAMLSLQGGITNTAPTMESITDRTIVAGESMLIVPRVQDAETSPQNLVFNLRSAPPGAVIQSSTGQLTWTPSASDVGGLFRFVIAVEDDGQPRLSAERSFEVKVVSGSAPVDYDVMLGRPTDRSIAVSLLPREDMNAYLEYGTSPGIYGSRTLEQSLKRSVPGLFTLQELAPNQRYYYRVRSASAGSRAFREGPQREFHTQRSRGSSFTFVIEADPHNRDNDPPVWQLALTNMFADRPDFLVDLGDTFMEEKVGATNAYYLTRPGIFELHEEVRLGFLGRIGHSIPTFLVNGNHEAELGWLLRLVGATNSPAVIGAEARQYYFPGPIPGGFYSGATARDPYTASPRDGYYAFEWGDVLIVVLDPFWYTTPKPQQNGWSWTLGVEQYTWLKRTLETSQAPYKFVFAHHLIGGGLGTQTRGGLAYSRFFEWGGFNTNGTHGFSTERPGWPAPIQDLLVQNGVQIFFHGHDHLFVKEELDQNRDGIPELIYQEVPQPSRINSGTNSAPVYGYTNGIVIGNSGHLRVNVTPARATIDYVRAFLPANEGAGRTNRMVSHSYFVLPASRTLPSKTAQIPDTRQTSNYGTHVNGMDSDYLLHPPSYTDRADGTVLDNVTGLIWQKQDGGEMTWNSARNYAATNRLGGFAAGTWRLPALHELVSILVYDRQNPALDIATFGSSGGNADYWWSGDAVAGDSTRIWVANAGGGWGPKPLTETVSAGGSLRYHVRLVCDPSGSSNPPANRFASPGDGTVADLKTGLVWQQSEVSGQLPWADAIEYAEGLTLGGFQDWRLPNIKELQSIQDITLASPAVDVRFFGRAQSGRYWSSTTQNNRPTNAWYQDFSSGLSSQAPKVSAGWVRAVRGGFSNTPPTLSPISDVVLTAGHEFQFDPTALDNENAATHLYFMLTADSPPLSLNRTNGHLAWRAPVAMVRSEFQVGLVVSDSGSPMLSSTQYFRLTGLPLASRPAVSSMGWDGDSIRLQISGEQGPDFHLQASTNLVNWVTILSTNPPALPLEVRDPNTDAMRGYSRFYRVLLGP